ncbi:MAG: tyrosine-type recombinase/integrase [Oscillospiraceae bacterium]|nr:tyrosine-type recombinase/integrase [Oscillospiraceae bacterium]
MASIKRRDNKGRILNIGESQMGDGRYRFQYTDGRGKRHALYSWRLVETDKMAVGKRLDRSLREKIRQVQRDLDDGLCIADGNKLTLNDLFQRYMAGKCELKQSTRTNYFYMYRHCVEEELGKRKIASIKYSDVKTYYDYLIRDRGMKPNSVELINTILHPVFTMAMRDGYIRTNPTDGVVGEIKKSHCWEKPKRHALTMEEQSAFIQYISHSSRFQHWLPLFTVFLGTGCRVGELIGLRWQDCDFKNRSISINHNMTYRQQENGKCIMRVTTPKTSAGIRTIPMLEEVRLALLKEKQQQLLRGGWEDTEIDGYHGFIFTNRNGYVHNPVTINKAIKSIYTAYNREEQEAAARENRMPQYIRHFSAHNLRHTFCTRFCENETNIKVIQVIMGHSDISTTMNIYAEVTENRKKQSFENLEGKIKIS